MEDRRKQLNSLLQSLHETEKKMSKKGQKQVMIEKAINMRLMCDYVISCSYLDVVLIICMLHDYVKLMDEVKTENIQYEVYYRKKFVDMAERLATQIEYDYEKQLEKCQKKSQKKDTNSDIGEDALILASGSRVKKKDAKTKSGNPEAKKTGE